MKLRRQAVWVCAVLILMMASGSWGESLSTRVQNLATARARRSKYAVDGEIKLADGEAIPTLVLTELPHKKKNKPKLPNNFDWRNVGGRNYLTALKNQHIPHYCGACWAFGSLSALSDRVMIMRQGQWPEINLSPQLMLQCGDAGDCGGGHPSKVFQYAKQYGLTDETCTPYTASDDKTKACTTIEVCKNCAKNGTCSAVPNPTKVSVSEFGNVADEDPMMHEIFARGPIACGISVTDEFYNYKSGIFEDKTGADQIKHLVSIVGWGEDNGTKYWIGRNSWGTYWGDNGFFKIVRGKNNMVLEEDCYWAVPDLPPELKAASVEMSDEAKMKPAYMLT